MQIVDFTAAHIEQAAQIAKQNYEAERGHVPALPPIDAVPDLTPFVENNLGVAAVDNGELLGYLCCWEPWVNAWDIPGLIHVFSPMHGNGTVPENRAKIYARLYQAAGAKWARAGATSHGICLYAHDTEGLAQFFQYGFGKRTVDAIRGMDGIDVPPCDGYTFSEITPENALEALPLENMLHKSYMYSPFFMFRAELSEKSWLEYYEECKPTCFVAKHDGQNAAFIIAEKDGETFIQDTPGYLHCTGMYCLPEHRGRGISQKLLNLMVQKLRSQGYTRFGVDFESFNPSGSGFWLKYFDAYTYGVVRRIDGRCMADS